MAITSLLPTGPAVAAPTSVRSTRPAMAIASVSVAPWRETRQDRVTLSPEAKRIADLVEGGAAAPASSGAGSSAAAFGRSLQERIRGILGGVAVAPTTPVSPGVPRVEVPRVGAVSVGAARGTEAARAPASQPTSSQPTSSQPTSSQPTSTQPTAIQPKKNSSSGGLLGLFA